MVVDLDLPVKSMLFSNSAINSGHKTRKMKGIESFPLTFKGNKQKGF